jgi:ribosomal protein S19
MARSIKKGPFVDLHLMKKVEAIRGTNDKRPITSGRAVPPCFRISWA